MQAFEEYARELTKGLALPEAEKERIRLEAIQHLEDEAARLMAGGASREDAEAGAISSFGREEVMARLVGGALEGRQTRFRLRRMAAAAAVCMVLGMAWEWGVALAIAGFHESPLGGGDYYFAFGARIGSILLLSWAVARFAGLPVGYGLFSGLTVLIGRYIGLFNMQFIEDAWMRAGLPELLAWLPGRLGPEVGITAWAVFCPAVTVAALGIALKADRKTAALAAGAFSLALLSFAGSVGNRILFLEHAYGFSLSLLLETPSIGLYWTEIAVLIWLLARAASMRFGRIVPGEPAVPLPA